MPPVVAGLESSAQVQVFSPLTLVISEHLRQKFDQAKLKGFIFFKPLVIDVEPATTFGTRLNELFSMAVKSDEVARSDDFWVVVPTEATTLGLNLDVVESCNKCGYASYAPYPPSKILKVMEATDVARFPRIRGMVVNETIRDILLEAGVDHSSIEPLPAI